MVDGNYGSDEYGSSPYGGQYPAFGIEAVIPLTPTLFRVRYTALFDAAFGPLVALGNYSLFPALTINSIVIETAQTVLVTTNPQDAVVYTLTIDQALGYFGQPLDPDLDFATFNGLLQTPTFFATATSNRRVRATFSSTMLQNAALTDTAQYSLTDLSGNVVSLASVEAEQSSTVRSVVVTTAEDLSDERHYVLTILSGVVTEEGTPLDPNRSLFQWVENALQTRIPLNRFSGEVQNGLYGIHGGLVFFSPALETAAANSVLQVDSVDVCTKAYDSYELPQPIDPPVLYTHGVVVSPTTLNSSAVLWAKFPRLAEARFEIADLQEDTMPAPTDGSCEATLREAWDLTYVSLLNNVAWKLFDNAGEPPTYFKTADNLAPIPSGNTTYIILKLPFEGSSGLEATPT